MAVTSNFSMTSWPPVLYDIETLHVLLRGADVEGLQGDDEVRVSLWKVKARSNSVQDNERTLDVPEDDGFRSPGLFFCIDLSR